MNVVGIASRRAIVQLRPQCLHKPRIPPRRPMGADCCDHRDLPDLHRGNPAYRSVLWAVLAINAVMFVVEIGAGLATGSAGLEAVVLDVLGDAANSGIWLLVV